MNPRILKKLSKRADPIVAKLVRGQRFVTERGDSIDSSQQVERKYFERWGGKPNTSGYFTTLKGTVGYGSMQGYYEPEWEENDAYSILQMLVENEFTDWEGFDFSSDGMPKCSINVRRPSVVFAHAHALTST